MGKVGYHVFAMDYWRFHDIIIMIDNFIDMNVSLYFLKKSSLRIENMRASSLSISSTLGKVVEHRCSVVLDSFIFYLFFLPWTAVHRHCYYSLEIYLHIVEQNLFLLLRSPCMDSCIYLLKFIGNPLNFKKNALYGAFTIIKGSNGFPNLDYIPT
ncbi:hypothetical protein BZL39_O02200 [Zygosaccharomyces parabailii]|nr:hypothetical protein BZL39_O02200 [Zygosaccharomyces parabailii]